MPVFGRVGPPRRRVCRDRGPARSVAWARVAAHRRAVSGEPVSWVAQAQINRIIYHWMLVMFMVNNLTI